MRALTKYNLLFYLVIIILAYILKNLYFVSEFISLIIIFNISVDFLFKLIIEKLGKNSFIINTIISTFIRLSFSLIFILLAQLYVVENLLIFIINFLIIYLLFIIFEITILLLNLHNIK